jgi:nucleotide-binding universal stress UspA family protein
MMTFHGRRGIKALLVGSETQKALTHSNIPVLVCLGANALGKTNPVLNRRV